MTRQLFVNRENIVHSN